MTSTICQAQPEKASVLFAGDEHIMLEFYHRHSYWHSLHCPGLHCIQKHTLLYPRCPLYPSVTNLANYDISSNAYTFCSPRTSFPHPSPGPELCHYFGLDTRTSHCWHSTRNLKFTYLTQANSAPIHHHAVSFFSCGCLWSSCHIYPVSNWPPSRAVHPKQIPHVVHEKVCSLLYSTATSTLKKDL